MNLPEFSLQLVRHMVTGILIALALGWFCRQGLKPAPAPAGDRRLVPHISIFWLAYGSMAFWLALILLAWVFPGNTKNVWLAQLVFGMFLVLSAVVAWCYHRWRLWWDDQWLWGPNWYGKTLCFGWHDVVRCDYNPGFQAFLIQNRRGQTIWLPEYWLGVRDFVTWLGQAHPAIHLPQLPPYWHDEYEE